MTQRRTSAAVLIDSVYALCYAADTLRGNGGQVTARDRLLPFAWTSVRVDTFSPQRAERARTRLLEIAGSCVTFDRIEVDVPLRWTTNQSPDRNRARARP